MYTYFKWGKRIGSQKTLTFVVGHGLFAAHLDDVGGEVRNLVQQTVVGQHALHEQLAQLAADQGGGQGPHAVVLLVRLRRDIHQRFAELRQTKKTIKTKSRTKSRNNQETIKKQPRNNQETIKKKNRKSISTRRVVRNP